MNIPCRICGGFFPPQHPSARLCSDKCKYVSMLLSSPQAKHMGRDKAIEYYGELYDDPLRLYRHYRHADTIQEIYDFCIAQDRWSFTCVEVAEDSVSSITHQKLAQIRRKYGILLKSDDKPATWTLSLPGQEIS